MNIYSGQPWTEIDIYEIGNCLARGTPVPEIAEFICRDVGEVRRKVKQLQAAATKSGREKVRPSGAPWTDIDLFRTAELRARGKTIEEAANNIGRQPADLKAKLEEIGFAWGARKTAGRRVMNK
jgi:hypothetical protein